MGKSHPQTNRCDTIGGALESSCPVRQVAGRSTNDAPRITAAEPLLAPLPAATRGVPVWGITAILGLIGLLGVVLHQRFSEQDLGWTRWEKHELTGIVLGQSPDRPASEPAALPAPRSSAPPLWSRSQTPRPESQRSPRTLETSAPEQAESAPAAAEDPFAADPFTGTTRAQAKPETIAGSTPRVLFESEHPRVAEAPGQHRIPAQSARPINTPAALEFRRDGGSSQSMRTAAAEPADQTPAELEFQAGNAPRSRGVTHAIEQQPERGRDGWVQPASGDAEAAEVMFPQQAESPEARQRGAAQSNLPAMEIPSQPAAELPEAGFELTPAAPAARHPQMALPDPEPTLSLPAQSRTLEPMEHLSQPASLPHEPSFLPASGQPRSLQTNHDTPMPQTTTLTQRPSATPAAPQEALPPDEVYQVQSGDNYWTISRRYYGSARFFSALAEYNKHRIPAPEKMKPGMYVLVPHIEVLHQRYPQLTGGGPRDPAENAPAGFFVDGNGQPCYRVGKGDTLTDIAQNYLGRSSRWVQIQGMNKERLAADGKTLKIGTVLRLPSDASQVVLAPSSAEIR